MISRRLLMVWSYKAFGSLRSTNSRLGMDFDSSLQCEECGRTFLNTAGLFNHQKKKCQPGKRSLQELLHDAHDYWKSVNDDAIRSSKRLKVGPTSRTSNKRRKSDKKKVELPATTLLLARNSCRSATGSEYTPSRANRSGFQQLRGVDDMWWRWSSTAAPSRGAGGRCWSGECYILSYSRFVILIFFQSQVIGAREDHPSQAQGPEDHEPRPDSPHRYFTTRRNALGLFKRFFGSQKPLHDPERLEEQGEGCNLGRRL
jgi:hypothetical protein